LCPVFIFAGLREEALNIEELDAFTVWSDELDFVVAVLKREGASFVIVGQVGRGHMEVEVEDRELWCSEVDVSLGRSCRSRTHWRH
jgi:hypothetical protein